VGGTQGVETKPGEYVKKKGRVGGGKNGGELTKGRNVKVYQGHAAKKKRKNQKDSEKRENVFT